MSNNIVLGYVRFYGRLIIAGQCAQGARTTDHSVIEVVLAILCLLLCISAMKALKDAKISEGAGQ